MNVKNSSHNKFSLAPFRCAKSRLKIQVQTCYIQVQSFCCTALHFYCSLIRSQPSCSPTEPSLLISYLNLLFKTFKVCETAIPDMCFITFNNFQSSLVLSSVQFFSKIYNIISVTIQYIDLIYLQVVTTEPNIEYAFAVEAVNVQGSSGFTQEKRISLTGQFFIRCHQFLRAVGLCTLTSEH